MSSMSSAPKPPRSQRKRFIRRPPDLTSLFDVLFIVVFVALIRAAAAEQALAKATAPPPPKPVPVEPAPPPIPEDVATLHKHGIQNFLHEDLDARSPIVMRIDAKPIVKGDIAATANASLESRIESIEVGGKRTTISSPLIRRDPASTIAWLGGDYDELRLCRVAAARAGLKDLSKHFVVVVPSIPRRRLPSPIEEGLVADIARCSDIRGLAALVDPGALPAVDPKTVDPKKSGSTGSQIDRNGDGVPDAISTPTNLPMNHPSRNPDPSKKTDP